MYSNGKWRYKANCRTKERAHEKIKEMKKEAAENAKKLAQTEIIYAEE